jgi:hypothetical protein
MTSGHRFFFVKGPAADATDAPQHRGLLCNPVMKMISFSFLFLRVMEHRWNEIDREKPKYSGKTCPSAILSTTNPTWNDRGSNPGLRGDRPATNSLSHGTAFHYYNVFIFITLLSEGWAGEAWGIYNKVTFSPPFPQHKSLLPCLPFRLLYHTIRLSLTVYST